MNLVLKSDADGRIETRIFTIRGRRVILDRDLAELYGVKTHRLNEQVRRNQSRFPSDFLFKLRPDEKIELIAICDHLETLKYSRRLPLVFTEHGAIMAASVLNSPAAIETSILVVRAFVRLREALAVYQELEKRVTNLEGATKEQREAIETVVQLLERLGSGDQRSTTHQIGFGSPSSGSVDE